MLEYLESGFATRVCVSLFYCTSIMNTAGPVITGCVIVRYGCARSLLSKIVLIRGCGIEPTYCGVTDIYQV